MKLKHILLDVFYGKDVTSRLIIVSFYTILASLIAYNIAELFEIKNQYIILIGSMVSTYILVFYFTAAAQRMLESNPNLMPPVELDTFILGFKTFLLVFPFVILNKLYLIAILHFYEKVKFFVMVIFAEDAVDDTYAMGILFIILISVILYFYGYVFITMYKTMDDKRIFYNLNPFVVLGIFSRNFNIIIAACVKSLILHLVTAFLMVLTFVTYVIPAIVFIWSIICTLYLWSLCYKDLKQAEAMNRP